MSETNKKENEEKKGVDLNELKDYTARLHGLLKDQHPGLITWQSAVRDALENVHRLSSIALGKQ